jgi:hypothetical protein
MDIELTNKKYIVIDPPIRLSVFNLLFDEAPVRVYRLTMSGAGGAPIAARKADVLIVLLKDSPYDEYVNGKLLRKKGDFIYIPSGNDIEIKNIGVGEVQYAFFELK